MNTREWALVAFTILSQMSVGAFLMLGVVHFFAARSATPEEADKLTDRALLAIGPTLVLGVIASFFHLGNPVNAPRALGNLGSSWLSLEALLSLTFLACGGVFAFLQWRKIGPPVLRNIIAVIAAVVGVVFIYAMSRVYMLPTVPAWNTLATPVSFFVTTFLLGALAIGTAFVVNYTFVQRKPAEGNEKQLKLLRDSLRAIAVLAIVMLGIEFVVTPLYIAHLAATGGAGAASAAVLAEQNGWLLFLRLVLVFLGAGVISIFVYQTALREGRVRFLGNLAYLAFALVLIAEVLGRYLFYASMVRVGI